MSAKFTPGPWQQDTRGYPHVDVRAEGGRAIAATWNVCSNQPKTPEQYDKRTAEDRANAHLISAAPDLLEALQMFVRYEDEMDIRADVQAMLTYATFSEFARAAIAKALGEQP